MKTAPREQLTLLVDASKKQAFLNMLKLFDFVSVETLPAKIKRYVKSAPVNVPLSDDEIMREIKTVRRKKARTGGKKR